MKWKEEEKMFILDNYLELTQPQMAEILSRKVDSVKSYMSNNGITLPDSIRSERFRKAISNTRKKLNGMNGKDNPNWKGGVSKNNYRYKLIQKERYPEKTKAREIVKSAVRSGKIIKGECKICGDDNTYAHHIDYKNPLEVIWLCRKHHRKEHGDMH